MSEKKDTEQNMDLRKKVPPSFLSKLATVWRLNEEQARALLKINELTDKNDIKARLKLLVKIRVWLDGFFRDVEVEKQWLCEKHEMLDKAKPLELILSGELKNLQRVEGVVAYMCGH